MAATHAMAAAELGMPVGWVASRSDRRARSLAGRLGATPCSFDQLPAGAGLVIVTTPPAFHAVPALSALAGGASALVEKPLATTLADADRLVDAEQGGGRVHYGENFVTAPVFAAALDRIRGAGRMRHIEARLLMPRPDWGDYLGGQWGGGALFDIGAHPLGLVLVAAADDQPVSVMARLQRPGGERFDDHGELELTFASGLRAVVVASWRHPSRVRDLHATGDSAVIRAELAPARSLEVNGSRVPLPVAPADPAAFRLHENGFVAQLAAVRSPSGRVAAPRLDASFGRRVLDVLCAAYASAGAGGAAVTLPFTGDRERTPDALWRSG